MGTRVQLHEVLKAITDNVYYQPPEGFKMKYPCIRYSRTKIDSIFADDNPYTLTKGYQVIVIYSDPDSDISDKVMKLQTATLESAYKSKNLYHDVFNIYY